MKFRKSILLSLLSLSSVFVANGQKPQVPPTPQIDDEDIACALKVGTEIIVVNISVLNSKKSFVENLTDYDFEVFYKKEKQDIDFFSVDKSNNKYKIGFSPKYVGGKYSFKDIKVKLKLSKEKKKQYGKVVIIKK